MYNWNIYTHYLAASSQCSLTYAMRAIIMAKGKWRPIELPLSRKTVTQNQYCIPGIIIEIRATIKNLGDVGTVIKKKKHPHPTCIFGLSRKQMYLRERQWVITGLTRPCLQLLLLCQAQFHCLRDFTHPLVPGVYSYCPGKHLPLHPCQLGQPEAVGFQLGSLTLPLHCPVSGVY